MARYTFANIGQWTRKTEQRMEAVFRDSSQTVAEEVKKTRSRGGHMRVDTGLLRSSLMASTSAMPVIDPTKRPEPGRSYPDENGQIQMVIAGADIGETIYLGFTAAHARPREYLDGFTRLTAMRWPQIVEASARKIKSRVETRG